MRARWKRIAPYAVPPLVFLAFLLAMFWRLWTPIDGARGTFSTDAVWQYWGNLEFQVDALVDGELPLWNPHDRAGYPFHTDPQAGMFYPLTWALEAIAVVVGSVPVWLITIHIFVHFWLAALGVYAYLRNRGNPLPACYVGGFIFILSYPFLHNLFSALNWNIAWAPWVLLAIDRFTPQPSYRRAAQLALTAGMCVLAGAPASLWYSMLVIIPYGVWSIVHHVRAAPDRRRYHRDLWRPLAAAAALVIAISAGQMLAAASVVPHTVRAARDLEFIAFSTFGVDDIAAFLIPRMLGGNTYLGVATVVWISILMVAFPTGRRLVLLAVAFLGVMLALGHGADFLPFSASALPPFGLFRRAHRFLYVAQLPVAILGAEGLAELVRSAGSDLARRIGRSVIVVGVMGLSIFGIGFVVAQKPNLDPQPLRDAFALACLAFVMTTWITVMVLRSRGRMHRTFAAMAVVALAADLWFAHREDIDKRIIAVPDTRRDRELASLADVPLGARIYDIQYFKYRPGVRLGIRDFGGYQDDPLALGRYALALKRAASAPRYLAHFNVGYLLEEGNKATKKGAADTKEVVSMRQGVYRIASHAPAVQWVDRATLVDGGPDVAMKEMLGHPAGSVAVLERGALDAETLSAIERDAGERAPSPGRISRFARNRIELEITAPAPGIVVVNEAFYPHWRARVDGEPAAVFPANVLSRGVLVDAGSHRIVMEYQPPWFRTLGLLSLLAWAAAAAMAWLPRRRPSV